MVVKKTTGRMEGAIGDNMIKRDGQFYKKIKNVNGINDVDEFLDALLNGDGVYKFVDNVTEVMKSADQKAPVGIIVDGIPINLCGERKEGDVPIAIQVGDTTVLSGFVGLEGMQQIEENPKRFLDELIKDVEDFSEIIDEDAKKRFKHLMRNL